MQSWLLDGTYALLETLSRDLRSEFYMSWSVDGREPEFNRGRIHALNGFLNMLLGMASNMSEPDPDFGEDHLANPLIDEDMSRAGYLLP